MNRSPSNNSKVIEALFKMDNGAETRLKFYSWFDFTRYLEKYHGAYTEVNAKIKEELA